MVKNILKLAVPTESEDSIFHIGKLLVQGIVTSYGTAAIAANAVALTISEFTHMPGFAIGLAPDYRCRPLASAQERSSRPGIT